jgi:DNA polymerase III alpha subunit (gram-positive type)
MREEIYISVDIEADGPIPGTYSMLSLGAASFYEGKLVDTFSRNLEPLEGATRDPKTMNWWSTQPEAWDACQVNQQHPRVVIPEFVNWVERDENFSPVCVCYPSGFDFTFLYWYLVMFAGRSPFGFSAIDLKTYAMAVLNKPYRRTTKRNMPKAWFKGLPKHTHLAVDDAIEQGELFCRVLEARKEMDK